ncbi:MAG: Peptidase M22 glycoprotease [Candidatus Tokpelaia sp. JSC161]|jgi:tRNA threonylcarbamoyl adenosine modification protein YeaZ|nr:MAG: Peptidase M22 glycoprotease [Candidatus Tokpelaia sp. JSC161]
MLVLSIDTASNFCSTCLLEGSRVLVKLCDDVGKRHAEHLIGQINLLMEREQRDLLDIDLISVSIGPGSFTGLRVGISAARGLALALAKPVIGVSVFEALACEAAQHYKGRPITVILEGSKGVCYVQDFSPYHKNRGNPRQDTAIAVAESLEKNTILIGSGAEDICRMTLCDFLNIRYPQIATYAFLATKKICQGKPLPLYMQAPSAKGSSFFVPS